MKRISLLTMSVAALLVAGSAAYAQEATTRGGADSVAPSTRQNSPATGAFTNPGANTNTMGRTTSGQGAVMEDRMQKPMKKGSKARKSQMRR